MTLDFLALSRSSTNQIISFLNLRSCVRLRMMCKLVKEVIDESILCIKSNVTMLQIDSTRESKVIFNFGFLSRTFFAQWKIWLIRQSSIHGYHFEGKLPLLDVTVKSSDLEKFCELLISLSRVMVKYVAIPIGEDLTRMCCDFLEGKSVKIVGTTRMQMDKAEIQDWNSWMYVIQRLKPIGFRYNPCTLERDTISFLEEVANNVMHISTDLYLCKDGHSIQSIVRRIFSRKCESLNFSTASFSVADAESMIQYLHRIKKRVSLEVVTNDHGIRTQMDVGMYSLNFERERITIKHRDMQPLFP